MVVVVEMMPQKKKTFVYLGFPSINRPSNLTVIMRNQIPIRGSTRYSSLLICTYGHVRVRSSIRPSIGPGDVRFVIVAELLPLF